jgi:tetratricopeptide (TPR) repeat protein
MASVYTPSATILLFAAFFTGVTFAAGSAMSKRRTYTLSISQNKRAGFALVGVVMIIIVGSSSGLYYIGRHYAGVYMYSGAATGLDGSTSIEAVEQKIAQAFSMVQSDQFARQIALYQLAKMNALLNVKEPTKEQQQAFQQAAANGVNAAQQAVTLDGTDPLNNSTLGSIYSVLASAGVEDAANRAKESFAAARAQDPTNPSYALLEAQLLARTGSAAEARAKIAEAVALKPNYTDALLFSTQLDVAEGKVGDAITTTRSIISLEPNNAARYYQLGILLSADKKLDEAIAALERAVAIDQNYANARYFLALGYIEKGNMTAAVTQLEAVLVLNPDNKDVQSLLDDVKAGRMPTAQSTAATSNVTEQQPQVDSEGGTVTTSEVPDTSLITPVNPVGEEAAPQTTE